MPQVGHTCHGCFKNGHSTPSPPSSSFRARFEGGMGYGGGEGRDCPVSPTSTPSSAAAVVDAYDPGSSDVTGSPPPPPLSTSSSSSSSDSSISEFSTASFSFVFAPLLSFGPSVPSDPTGAPFPSGGSTLCSSSHPAIGPRSDRSAEGGADDVGSGSAIADRLAG